MVTQRAVSPATPGLFPIDGDSHDVKLVSCILREEKVDEVIEEIVRLNCASGITMTEARGYDPRSQTMTQFRGIVYRQVLSTRIRLEVAVPTEKVPEVVRAIRDTARTGKTGDGKIFVTNVDLVERIRTGEKNLSAV